MSEYKLIKTRMLEGIWQGVLTGGTGRGQPKLEVSHLGEPLAGVVLTEQPDGAGWIIQVPIPVEMISDGVQTFVVREPGSNETLESFTILAGDALGDDIRAEMDLLREELDMLKRAFRRHCLETM